MILIGISFCMTNFEGLKTMSMKNKHYVREKKSCTHSFLTTSIRRGKCETGQV